MGSELRLAKELSRILDHSKEKTFTFGTLLRQLGVQGQIVFLMLLVTPMLQPIPMPFISSVLSFMAVITCYQLLFKKPPWLPRRYHEKEIDSRKLEKWLLSGIYIIEKLERVCHPRKRWGGGLPEIRTFVTVLCMFTSFLLALPLPIPFSNFFPAVAIFLFGMGLLEDDGLFYCFGTVLFLIATVYIIVIFFIPWSMTHQQG